MSSIKDMFSQNYAVYKNIFVLFAINSNCALEFSMNKQNR